MLRVDRWLFAALLSAVVWVFAPISAWCEAVKVGVLRMEVPHFSPHISNSIRMALQDVHNQGILGNERTLQLIERYVPSDPRGARDVVEKLITRDRVSILLTSAAEDAAVFEMASVAQAHKVPLLVCLCGADRITEQGWEYVFRLMPPASEYFNGVRHFLSVVARPKTFACLYEEGFTFFHPSMFENERKAGMELVLLERYSKDTTDFRPLLRRLKEKNPDAIYLISLAEDAALLLNQCRELEVAPKVMIGFVSYALPDFWKLAGDAANYVIAPTYWLPSLPYPGCREYQDRYLKKYGTPSHYFGAMTYAAVQVLADASRRARSVSPSDLRDALASTDIIAILGKIKFVSYGKKTQQNRLPQYLIQWVDGRPRTVWPPQWASYQYIYPFPKWKKPGLVGLPFKPR
jgi:branched-chain amino acid transport system substrate-binding protein